TGAATTRTWRACSINCPNARRSRTPCLSFRPEPASMTGMATVIFGEALVDEFPTEQVIGGAPFNVARHLAAFMAPPLMITRIGDDRNGQAVRAEFERFVMPETGLQIDPIEETGRVVVERDAQGKPEGHRFIILPRQAYDFIDPQAAASSLGGVPASLLYFGTL